MMVWLLVAVGVIGGNPSAGVVGEFKTKEECVKASVEVDKTVQKNIKDGMPVDAYVLECKGLKLGK